jgi:hypothetical protein
MSAVEALALAHAGGVLVSLAGDFIRYQSHGPPPERVLHVLRAEKPAIVALLRRKRLDASGALVREADDLFVPLGKSGFRVRRYGDQAGLDDDTGQGRVPLIALLREFADRQLEYGVLLVALGAPDMLAGKGWRLRNERWCAHPFRLDEEFGARARRQAGAPGATRS